MILKLCLCTCSSVISIQKPSGQHCRLLSSISSSFVTVTTKKMAESFKENAIGTWFNLNIIVRVKHLHMQTLLIHTYYATLHVCLVSHGILLITSIYTAYLHFCLNAALCIFVTWNCIIVKRLLYCINKVRHDFLGVFGYFVVPQSNEWMKHVCL